MKRCQQTSRLPHDEEGPIHSARVAAGRKRSLQNAATAITAAQRLTATPTITTAAMTTTTTVAGDMDLDHVVPADSGSRSPTPASSPDYASVTSSPASLVGGGGVGGSRGRGRGSTTASSGSAGGRSSPLREALLPPSQLDLNAGPGGGRGPGGAASCRRITLPPLMENKALTWSQAQRRRCCPSPAERKKLRRCIESPRFEYGIALALICNAVVVFCEIGTDLRGDFVVEAAAWEIVEAVFTTLFILEMVLKLLAFGCAGYWGNVLNAYDGIITLVSGAAELYVFIPNNYNNPSLVRYVLLARLLRLARLLSAFTCFQVVFGTLRRIVPMMATFIGMLWCIVSSFAAAGVALFGGLVYVNNTKLVEAELPDTYYYMVRALSLPLHVPRMPISCFLSFLPHSSERI